MQLQSIVCRLRESERIVTCETTRCDAGLSDRKLHERYLSRQMAVKPTELTERAELVEQRRLRAITCTARRVASSNGRAKRKCARQTRVMQTNDDNAAQRFVRTHDDSGGCRIRIDLGGAMTRQWREQIHRVAVSLREQNIARAREICR